MREKVLFVHNCHANRPLVLLINNDHSQQLIIEDCLITTLKCMILTASPSGLEHQSDSSLNANRFLGVDMGWSRERHLLGVVQCCLPVQNQKRRKM